MRIARVSIDNNKTYGFVSNNAIFAKEDVEEALKINLPERIEDYLLSMQSIEISDLEPLHDYRLLPPITEPSKIICLGFNYLDHAREQNKKPPDEPVIFMKPRTTLIGAFDDIIAPKFIKELDYEGELAFVINKKCKNVSIDQAMDYVLGYMVFNDVSARDIQFNDKQWTRGKSFDTFAPCGPYLTTRDEINNPHNLRIVTKVNGEVRQDSNTSNMHLKIDKIIASLSKVMTLEPLDIIATGTPSGVAMFMQEQKFLRDDDLVEIEIEGLGRIANRVRFID
jgi:2-keto-4-pentenoate hydratase/2-oxohepta-3-ene-1,7-dioic acid hydratase in catechol pathway